MLSLLLWYLIFTLIKLFISQKKKLFPEDPLSHYPPLYYMTNPRLNTTLYQLIPQSLWSSLVLNVLMDGEATISAGKEFQLFTTLTL